MAKIIRLLDYEPVARPQGFKPSAPADILFFTGVRYERTSGKKAKKSGKNDRRIDSTKRHGAN